VSVRLQLAAGRPSVRFVSLNIGAGRRISENQLLIEVCSSGPSQEIRARARGLSLPARIRKGSQSPTFRLCDDSGLTANLPTIQIAMLAGSDRAGATGNTGLRRKGLGKQGAHPGDSARSFRRVARESSPSQLPVLSAEGFKPPDNAT